MNQLEHTVSSLLPGETTGQKWEALTGFIQTMTGKPVTVNEEVFRSEWDLTIY